jgi:hypothetical protein
VPSAVKTRCGGKELGRLNYGGYGHGGTLQRLRDVAGFGGGSHAAIAAASSGPKRDVAGEREE